ncbi:MAG: DUF1127 domain-containing protein [Acidiferrobacterales bacterium]
MSTIRRRHSRTISIRQLMALDDRMLDNIGLRRCEIESVVDELLSSALPSRTCTAPSQRAQLTQHLRKPRPPRILHPTRRRLAALWRWHRRRMKPSVRRWVDDYLSAIKENGA